MATTRDAAVDAQVTAVVTGFRDVVDESRTAVTTGYLTAEEHQRAERGEILLGLGVVLCGMSAFLSFLGLMHGDYRPGAYPLFGAAFAFGALLGFLSLRYDRHPYRLTPLACEAARQARTAAATLPALQPDVNTTARVGSLIADAQRVGKALTDMADDYALDIGDAYDKAVWLHTTPQHAKFLTLCAEVVVAVRQARSQYAAQRYAPDA